VTEDSAWEGWREREADGTCDANITRGRCAAMVMARTCYLQTI
jgi:hypothetical protein